MYSFKAHYEKVLAEHYTRVFGGADTNYRRNRTLLEEFGISRGHGKIAFDLGAGTGFFTIPLAQMGFSVVAVDLEQALLDEIEASGQELPVETVRGDILSFSDHVRGYGIDLVVCTTDVISHLNSYEEMDGLFAKIFLNLHENGRFLLSYRDQTTERTGADRFIPFYGDDGIIMTTFVEFFDDRLDVTDIIHTREGGRWQMTASPYRKLRLYDRRVKDLLERNRLKISQETNINGMTYVLCGRGDHGGCSV